MSHRSPCADRRRFLSLVGAAAGASLAGCSHAYPITAPQDPARSLVFGFIDMSEAPSGIDWAVLRQVEPPAAEPLLGMSIDDGLFYHDQLSPGVYVLDEFGDTGSFFFGKPTIYGGGRQTSPTKFQLAGPGLHFVGSYAVVPTEEKAWGGGDAYDIVPATQPSEREVLMRLLEHAEGTAWESKVRARIAEVA